MRKSLTIVFSLVIGVLFYYCIQRVNHPTYGYDIYVDYDRDSLYVKVNNDHVCREYEVLSHKLKHHDKYIIQTDTVLTATYK